MGRGGSKLPNDIRSTILIEQVVVGISSRVLQFDQVEQKIKMGISTPHWQRRCEPYRMTSKVELNDGSYRNTMKSKLSLNLQR
jgi:hypothetical protein